MQAKISRKFGVESDECKGGKPQINTDEHLGAKKKRRHWEAMLRGVTLRSLPAQFVRDRMTEPYA
jgi:hypothetical protein